MDSRPLLQQGAERSSGSEVQTESPTSHGTYVRLMSITGER